MMYSLLRFGLWLLRALLFIGLLGLAIKNSGAMELRFFFDRSWQLPISVVVLASFAAGLVVGLGAFAGRRWRRKSQDQH
jgi:uncharacterized integral membrane protein